jgi:hypothetical protein
MKANEQGPDYYRTADNGEQLWDRMWRLYGRGPFIFNIVKYVERYHMKNGIDDLLKAQHYLKKLIELEEAKLVEKGAPREWKPGAGPEQFERADREFQDERHRSLMASPARFEGRNGIDPATGRPRGSP